MLESVESVNSIVDELRTLSEKSNKPAITKNLQDYANALEFVSAELLRLKGLTSALPPDLGNIYDLPSELLGELSISKADELEDQIVTAINAYGGEASLDQILVGLFRKFGVVQKRRFMQNKLYRMPMVWSVEGRKGIYTTTEPEVGSEVASEADSGVSGDNSPDPYEPDYDAEIPF